MKSTLSKPKILRSVSLLIFAVCLSFQATAQTEQNGEQVKIAKDILETYLGDYQMGADTLKIIMQGDSIKADGPGYPPLELIPRKGKNNRFLLRKFGVDIEFVKGTDDKIEKLLMIRADGQSLEAPKIG